VNTTAQQVVNLPPNLSEWQDYLDAMKQIGVDDCAAINHIHTMRDVRLTVIGNEVTRRVKGFFETIIEGNSNNVTICFIHSVLGISTEVLDFAEMLGPEYRLLSVRPASKSRNRHFPSSIEGMAEKYAEAVIEAQPEGSLVLCGRSAGVVIGLHMAQILATLGRPISLFVALDFAPYNTGADFKRFNIEHNYQIIRNWLHQCFLKFKERRSLSHLINVISTEVKQKVQIRCGKPNSNPRSHPIIEENEIVKYSKEEILFVDVCDFAMKKYEYGKKCEFPVLVFLSTKEPDRSEYRVLKKWKKITYPKLLRYVTIHGSTHRSIAERPLVLDVANHVRQEIAGL
jgi:thioesterase domain-containing protein